ncbi:MAG: peptidoglycan-binding protein, partial [Candidatus Wildermuthbacteria bacterium]|nr:peptidoglycan-binding protein [Candidatus Wildermuthbacteria bacterium]
MPFFDFGGLRAYLAESLNSFRRIKRLPAAGQWLALPGLLSAKERITLVACVAMFLFSAFFVGTRVYTAYTRQVPAIGGAITEGVIGFPRFINPVYAEASDADRDIVSLVFSGLLAYNAKGELVEDLAQSFAVEDGGKSITVSLKDNVQWHDGKPFGADDVLFTIQTLQDPKYKSPVRGNWVGVDVEKLDERTVRFSLRSPYAPFLDRLTVKIIPRHIWKDVPPENFALSPFNLRPVGTGSFEIERVEQDRAGFVTRVQLKANYFGARPFLQRVTFVAFATENELVQAAARGEVSSFSPRSAQSIEKIPQGTFSRYAFSLPRYFAIFFNLGAESGSPTIQQKSFRKALAQSIDSGAIIQRILRGNADPVSSPLLPSLFGLREPGQKVSSDLEKAGELLESLGYKKEQGVWMRPAQKKVTGIQGVLESGSKGSEVKKLQECLAKDSGVYPSGKISGTFDEATKNAVVKFQEQYAKDILAPQGLTKGTGKVAGGTKAKLNEICFAATDATPLTLTLATIDQPPLNEVAGDVADQWRAFGIETEVKL